MDVGVAVGMGPDVRVVVNVVLGGCGCMWTWM